MYELWNGWKAKGIIDMADCGGAVLYNFVREPGVQEYEVGICVSTLIVIYKAANKEE